MHNILLIKIIVAILVLILFYIQVQQKTLILELSIDRKSTKYKNLLIILTDIWKTISKKAFYH